MCCEHSSAHTCPAASSTAIGPFLHARRFGERRFVHRAVSTGYAAQLSSCLSVCTSSHHSVLRTGFYLWVLVPLQTKGMMLQCPVSSAEHLHSNIWVLSSCCMSNADCSGGTEGQEATAWAKHKSKCEHSPLLPLYSPFPPAGCAY